MKSAKSQDKLIWIGISLTLIVLTFFTVSAGVTGLSEARIVGNYFGFSKAWIVSFVSSDFTTDKINAFFTPSDFESVSGTKTKQSLTISAQTKPSSCEWSLKRDVSRPDVFELVPFTGSKWTTDVESAKKELSAGCYDLPGLDYYWKSTSVWGTGKVQVWCTKVNQKLATSGGFVNEFIVAETDWSVTASGKTPQTALVTNAQTGDGRTTKLGDRVWIQWLGLAGTGEKCPLTQDSIPLHSNTFSSGWRVGKMGNYNTYVNYLSTAINDIGRWKEGIIIESTFKNILLTQSNNAIQPDYSFGSFSVLNQDVDNGKIKVDLGRLIVFPMFRLIIDADYLEVDISAGIPKIVSVSDVKFNEGSAGKVNAIVKNDANSGEGGFNVRVIDCSSGFSSNTPTQGVKLKAQDEKTLTFEIIGSSTSDQATIKGFCYIEMKEAITNQAVRMRFNTEMSQIKECPPPEFACGVEGGLHVIKQCNSQGTGLVTIEKCNSDQICELTSTGAECIDKNKPPKGCKWYDLPCHIKNIFSGIGDFFKGIFDFTGGIMNILRSVVVLIVGIFGTLFGKDLISSFRAMKRKEKTAWAIALLLGGALAFLVWKVFFVGLVIFIIFIIIKSIISATPIGRAFKLIRR